MKYCETLIPGFYLQTVTYKDGISTSKRAYYFSGATKGNKWIDLNVPNPRWNGLMWNCITEKENSIGKMEFFGNINPTKFKL
jgi:hypothetical protein